MLFYGYVDNGETFVKAKITAESAAEAYLKLEKFASAVEAKLDNFRGNIECLILRDEAGKEICQTGDDIDKCVEAYDNRLKLSLADKIQAAEASVTIHDESNEKSNTYER